MRPPYFLKKVYIILAAEDGFAGMRRNSAYLCKIADFYWRL